MKPPKDMQSTTHSQAPVADAARGEPEGLFTVFDERAAFDLRSFEAALWSLVKLSRAWEKAYHNGAVSYESLDSEKTSVEQELRHLLKLFRERVEQQRTILRQLQSAASQLATAQQAVTMTDDAPLFADDGERSEFVRAIEEFQDCNETSVEDRLLTKWAASGLLECNNFLVTEKGADTFADLQSDSEGDQQ